VYLIAATTAAIMAASCIMIRPYPDLVARNGRGGRTASVFEAVRPSVMLPGMLEGLRHLWREKTVFGAIVLDLFAVLLGGATALLPIYAKDILNAGPIGLGALRASPYVGALIVAIVMAHRPSFERTGRALLVSVAGYGLCTIGFGYSTDFWLSLALLLGLGALDGVSVIIRHVLVSVRTPDHLRGRVNAVNAVFIESSNELGGFRSAVAASWMSPVMSVVTGGAGTILVVLGIALGLPELRRLGKLGAPTVEAPPVRPPGGGEGATSSAGTSHGPAAAEAPSAGAS
jgi:hypothetical protein